MYDPLRAKTKVALSVAACFLFGMALASQLGFSGPAGRMLVVHTGPSLVDASVQPALDLIESFVNIADAVTPAVVMIEAKRQVTPRSPFGDLFGGAPQVEVPVGGSGFIVSADGYVMTNNHVVESAERITVSLKDGRRFTAEVVGTDPTTDIAVIKIDGEEFPTASLGSSAEVRVGEWVLAVGNPGFAQGGPSPDLDYTVTAGIVSALGRSLSLINRSLRQDPDATARPEFAIEDFIQTDAVINSGNSGGPLVNLRGQVIGVNSAIVSRTGAYQGYGFAIPIDLAHRVMEDLVAHGRVRRAFLGVTIESVDEADAEYLGLPEVAGAFVQSLGPGAPAERAGIKEYDVITGARRREGAIGQRPAAQDRAQGAARPSAHHRLPRWFATRDNRHARRSALPQGARGGERSFAPFGGSYRDRRGARHRLQAGPRTRPREHRRGADLRGAGRRGGAGAGPGAWLRDHRGRPAAHPRCRRLARGAR